MTTRLPNFLIVGAARSGTSWLAKNLSTHPDVFVPSCKEVHFFDRHYDKGIEWYERYFAGRTETWVGEATPAYLYFERIPSLIRTHIPNAKIIAILRNPVDRAYSHYWNLVAKSRHKDRAWNPSFEEQLAETTRIIDEGCYTSKLNRYFERFPSQNIKVMFYDDLVREPVNFLRQAIRFLGADEEFGGRYAREQINSTEMKLRRSKIVGQLQSILTRSGMSQFVTWFNRQNKPELPPMKRETRRMLLEKYYLAEIETLEEMFDRELTAWKVG